MKSYFKILNYVRPYWKHLILTFIFSLLFAAFGGMSVYLTIPLLDTLFQESLSKAGTEKIEAEPTESIIPDWITGISKNISNYFDEMILTGDQVDILVKICIIIFLAFFY